MSLERPYPGSRHPTPRDAQEFDQAAVGGGLSFDAVPALTRFAGQLHEGLDPPAL